jgi:membrane-bound metal-dependent hydrolase YbcI (DUF457 family)
MDALVHSAVGACIGWALPRRISVGAAPLVLVGALLPDIEYFTDPFVDPRSPLAHRGFTHSLVGILVLAPLAALVVFLFYKKKRFARLVALIAIGMLSHVFLDIPTPVGVMLFYPFSRNHVHLDFLGYLDWTLFMLALFVLLTVWTYSNPSVAVRRGVLTAILLSVLSWWLYSEWPTQAFYFAATKEEATEQPFRTVYPLVLGAALLVLFIALARRGWGFRQSRAVFGRLGLVAFSVYLIVCLTAQGIVLNRTRQFTRERGIVARRRLAARMGFSSLVGPFRWTGLVLAPEGVYDAQIVPFSTRKPTFTFFPSSIENPCITKTRSIGEVRYFLSAARFPVTRCSVDRGKQIVEYQEFGLSWRPLLRVVLNERQEVLDVGWIEH